MLVNNRLERPIAAHAACLPAAWLAVLGQPHVANALASAGTYVAQRLAEGAIVYPATPFRALQDLEPGDVRVIILGQDPYHGAGQAQGLAFSVPNDCVRPPSLRNIYTELALEYPTAPPVRGNELGRWVRQGVLLLNTVLTVEEGKPASHARRGWETVTDAIIAHVASEPTPKVFMLWGAHAQAKKALLPDHSGHLVLMANHPSPLSARRPPLPFIGCGHFRTANEWLEKQGRPPISWMSEEIFLPQQGEIAL